VTLKPTEFPLQVSQKWGSTVPPWKKHCVSLNVCVILVCFQRGAKWSRLPNGATHDQRHSQWISAGRTWKFRTENAWPNSGDGKCSLLLQSPGADNCGEKLTPLSSLQGYKWRHNSLYLNHLDCADSVRITSKPEYAGPPHLFSLSHRAYCCGKLRYRGASHLFFCNSITDCALWKCWGRMYVKPLTRVG